MGRKNLYTALTAKANALRVEEAAQKEASLSFIEASRRAEVAGGVAEKHAVAVETALNIIAEAGVTL